MDPATVQDLLRRIEEKDLSTAAHTWRVVLYTRILAEAFGADRATLHQITHGAAMHDIGKLDLPGEILRKPARLTPREREIIKLHPAAGYARLIHLDVEDEPILDLVKHHHERWDGLGYPFGLCGEQISVVARFFAVIDSFDALTSIRPYRQAIGNDAATVAINELIAGKGTRYWPDAVDAFCDLYRRGTLDFVLHYFNDECDAGAFKASDVDALFHSGG